MPKEKAQEKYTDTIHQEMSDSFLNTKKKINLIRLILEI